MGKRNDTDKAIRNLMNWANNPDWADVQADIYDLHLGPVADLIGVTEDELLQEVAENGYDGMLFGMMFEDFVSRSLPPDDTNIIDDYLKRRGWRESVPGRRYLQQLRQSVLSLYEVVEVSQGHHCDIRDVVRGGQPFRVHERMGTQNLVMWDHIAARVLTINGKKIFSGGILPFPLELGHSLAKALGEAQKQFAKEHARAARKKSVGKTLPEENLDELFLRDTCPLFTTSWLMDLMDHLDAPLPELSNTDGDTLLFTETRYPFLDELYEEIAQRLDATPDWERDSPSESSWVWLPEPNGAGEKPQDGIMVGSLRNGQHPICGTLDLKPGVLTLTTNSKERADRGQELLEALLDGLIGPPLSLLQTPEQLMADGEFGLPDDDHSNSADEIDPEIAAEIVRKMMDKHYRECLDERIPALGNKTPRQCAKSKKGREKVIEWLKYLENNERRRASDQGQDPYDSSWMWDELKLGEHRNS